MYYMHVGIEKEILPRKVQLNMVTGEAHGLPCNVQVVRLFNLDSLDFQETGAL